MPLIFFANMRRCRVLPVYVWWLITVLVMAEPAMAAAEVAKGTKTPEVPVRATTSPAPGPTPTAAKANRNIEANPLILEVQLDGSRLTDGLTAYQDGPQILLPLGELARLLTLAVTVHPESGQASGYVLSEERTFGLKVEESLISLPQVKTNFESRRVRVIDDDIYVNSSLLSRWLPIDFDVNLLTQQLQVKPREKLPLQERLERERAASRLGGPRTERLNDPGYPRVIAAYQLIDHPFIDQTFGSNLQKAPGSQKLTNNSTTYVTADVLGMEGAAYISRSSDQPKPQWRVTLGRNDPDGGLFGPLQARSFSAGNISVPSVANIMTTSGTGRGAVLSNRALDQPTSFDRQSLRGDLPPGWDVTLYYNEALLGFQASRADGLYAFDDLPLSFGPNEFSLVFNGPLGQMRTERKSFLLDQSAVKPGELLYTLAQHYDDLGGVRTVSSFDMGLSPSIAVNAGFVRMPRPTGSSAAGGLLLNGTQENSYSQFGVRGFTSAAIFTSDVTIAPAGKLADLGVKTRLAGFAVDLLHTQVTGDFDSDVFSSSGDPTRRRDQIRAVGTLPLPGNYRLPIAVDAQRDVLKSGTVNQTVSGRLSWMMGSISLTDGLAWQRLGSTTGTSTTTTTGNLQATSRVAEMGLSGQLGYSVSPIAHVDSLAVTVDRNLPSGYRVNGGLLRTFTGSSTLLSGGLSKNFGRFALAVSASLSSQRELAIGLQLFVAMGREPRTGQWFAQALPMAGTGAVSARAFVDNNLNGIRDATEELVPNAGFIINQGGRYPARTTDEGTAFISQLTPGQYADIALDPTTLEDPLWKPSTKGVRVLPRPGLVQVLEFPVVSTSEIDGTVRLLGPTGRRPIGDVVVELVNAQNTVVKSTTSSSDGFYLLREVFPGHYTLRISIEQARKLALHSSPDRPIDVLAEGDFISGLDLEASAASDVSGASEANKAK